MISRTGETPSAGASFPVFIHRCGGRPTLFPRGAGRSPSHPSSRLPTRADRSLGGSVGSFFAREHACSDAAWPHRCDPADPQSRRRCHSAASSRRPGPARFRRCHSRRITTALHDLFHLGAEVDYVPRRSRGRPPRRDERWPPSRPRPPRSRSRARQADRLRGVLAGRAEVEAVEHGDQGREPGPHASRSGARSRIGRSSSDRYPCVPRGRRCDQRWRRRARRAAAPMSSMPRWTCGSGARLTASHGIDRS